MNTHRTPIRTSISAALLLALAAVAANVAVAAPVSSPHADLSPAEVVQAQLQGFQSNSDENQGIALAYRFASPGNRVLTGPVERFTKMLVAAYPELLNHRNARIVKQQVENDFAVIAVVVESADLEIFNYIFRLSKQTEAQTRGSCTGCWMTDSVFRESAGSII